MLLSRFWSILLSLALGVSAFTLFLASQMYNHAGTSAMSQALSADSSSVDWFLRDDARKRAAAIIPMAISHEVGDALAKASGDAKVDDATRTKVKDALRKLFEDLSPELKFDTIWAVDANGRVVASVGDDKHVDNRNDKDLGGHSSVADALHGWVRDDAWVEDKVIRVVMRPVEREAQSEPVGAIVGATWVNDDFARAVSKRTGAAVAFYAGGVRVASGAPEGFDKANLDAISNDLKALDKDKDYQEKGRSDVRVLGQHLGVVYARLPGEAWELGAGYAVGHLAVAVSSPFDFVTQADKSDQARVPAAFIIAAVVLLVLLGLGMSYAEYNSPLNTFRTEAQRLAKGEIDVFAPSRFRGLYKKIAADLNDGMEKVSAKGGAPRRAADLEQVLGPIPSQPSMSAFSVFQGQMPVRPSVEPPSRSAPRPPDADRSAPRLRQSGQSGQSGQIQAVAAAGPTEAEAGEAFDVRMSAPTPEVGAKAPPVPPKRPGPPSPPGPAAQSSSVISLPAVGDEFDEVADWRRVYEEFLALKKQCGEDTSSLTFEKFKGTLQRNKDALVARHSCNRVKFTVYVKEGKAALKASPVK